jgi:DNA-binding transcriptional MerR regulator
MGRLTMAELEHLSAVPRSTVYAYIRKGLLPPAVKGESGRSLFTEQHVEALATIDRLLGEGRSLDEIRTMVGGAGPSETPSHAPHLADLPGIPPDNPPEVPEVPAQPSPASDQPENAGEHEAAAGVAVINEALATPEAEPEITAEATTETSQATTETAQAETAPATSPAPQQSAAVGPPPMTRAPRKSRSRKRGSESAIEKVGSEEPGIAGEGIAREEPEPRVTGVAGARGADPEPAGESLSRTVSEAAAEPTPARSPDGSAKPQPQEPSVFVAQSMAQTEADPQPQPDQPSLPVGRELPLGARSLAGSESRAKAEPSRRRRPGRREGQKETAGSSLPPVDAPAELERPAENQAPTEGEPAAHSQQLTPPDVEAHTRPAMKGQPPATGQPAQSAPRRPRPQRHSQRTPRAWPSETGAHTPPLTGRSLTDEDLRELIRPPKPGEDGSSRYLPQPTPNGHQAATTAAAIPGRSTAVAAVDERSLPAPYIVLPPRKPRGAAKRHAIRCLRCGAVNDVSHYFCEACGDSLRGQGFSERGRMSRMLIFGRLIRPFLYGLLLLIVIAALFYIVTRFFPL